MYTTHYTHIWAVFNDYKVASEYIQQLNNKRFDNNYYTHIVYHIGETVYYYNFVSAFSTIFFSFICVAPSGSTRQTVVAL